MGKIHVKKTLGNDEILEQENSSYQINKNWQDFSKWQNFRKAADGGDYERIAEEIRENNAKLLESFGEYLAVKEQLSQKVIRRHQENASLFIDDYLLYYDIKTVATHAHEVPQFISEWYVGKFLQVNMTNVSQLGASMKKFFIFLAEAGEISSLEIESSRLMIKNAVKEGQFQLENT